MDRNKNNFNQFLHILYKHNAYDDDDIFWEKDSRRWTGISGPARLHKATRLTFKWGPSDYENKTF